MSEHDLTPDELVSAYVDDELSDAERAHVEADPELVALVQRFRAVASAVAEPVPPPPADHRDRAIAAALATSSTVANVRSIEVARVRRRSPRVVAIASVAAVVAIVLLVVPIVLSTRDGEEIDLAGEDTADVATTDAADGDAAFDTAAEAEASEAVPAEEAATFEAEAPAEEDTPAEEEAAAEEEMAAEEPGFDAEDELADDSGGELVPTPTDLGEFVGLPELRSRILEQRIELTGPLRDATECAVELNERFDSSTAELEVVALAGGIDVVSYVIVDEDGNATLVVLDRDTCSVLTIERL